MANIGDVFYASGIPFVVSAVRDNEVDARPITAKDPPLIPTSWMHLELICAKCTRSGEARGPTAEYATAKMRGWRILPYMGTDKPRYACPKCR